MSRKKEGADAGTETDINLFHELYYHFLGTDQSEDILCWRDVENASWLTSAKVTEDGQVYLHKVASLTLLFFFILFSFGRNCKSRMVIAKIKTSIFFL